MSKNVTASILQESKKTKQKSRLWWIILMAIVVLVGVVYFLFFTDSAIEEKVAVAEVISPTNGDLRVSIESDGTIINPNIIDLSFLISGTLDIINVVEGDRVEMGEELAVLDTRDLEFDLRSAESSLQIAYANYKAKTAMLTDTQVKELENSLASQQDELDSITRGVDQDLQQALDLGVVDLEVVFPTLETALQMVDSILLEDVSYSDNNQVLSATNDSIGVYRAKNLYKDARRNFDELENSYRERVQISDSEVSNMLRKTQALAQEIQDLIDQMVASLRTAMATSKISQSKIDSVRSEINSMNSKVLSEVTSLTSTIQRIESAYLNQQSKIVTAENSITKLETQMETAIESVEEKEISKQTSLSVLSAQITQAQIKVDKAKYNLELAKLSSPISGEIIQLNGNEGEAIKIESTSSDTAFIKILSDSNFTTEVYIAREKLRSLLLRWKAY
ncbi:biotin/lipoyl-binding protein, partial [bacterium]|nr:biotin/lipoyl-binding protein [bacterium]